MNIITEMVLFEKYENLLSDPKYDDRKVELSTKIYNMIQNSYRKIGGNKGKGFETPESMVKEIPFWKIFRRGDEIKAVLMYKNENGRKRVAVATDGTKEGKEYLGKLVLEDYLQGRAYVEISGPSLEFTKKLLKPEQYEFYSIPFDKVKEIINKDIKEIPGEKYNYYRKIGNEYHIKRMLGTLENI